MNPKNSLLDINQKGWLKLSLAKSSIEPQTQEVIPAGVSINSQPNSHTGEQITSQNLKGDKNFMYDMHIAEVCDKYLSQMYPHAVNPPESARLDSRHHWEVKNDRYKEFIEFYEQYQRDLKRVSYH